MRILITEIGNASSGDEAICIGAARRLMAMGAELTFLYRVSLEKALSKAGLDGRHIHMPLEEDFEGIDMLDSLVEAFADHAPSLYRKVRKWVSCHDVVAVAPGGKFTEGFRNARTLLTAAVGLSMGVPVLILHQSVGPIDNPYHRRLLTKIFTRCSLVLVRDERSLTFLRELGIPEGRLVPCRDVVMGEAYPPPRNELDYDLGVNIRCGFSGHVSMEALSEFLLGYQAHRPKARVLVYSTTFDLPPGVVAHLSSLPCDMQVKVPSYPDYVREAGRCAVNVSDSIHGVLFSMMAGRPVISCQTDLRTWKLEGIHAPEQDPLEVLPGLISSEEGKVVLDRVLAVERDPRPVLERQQRILQHGKQMCEEGWARVEKTFLPTHAAPSG